MRVDPKPKANISNNNKYTHCDATKQQEVLMPIPLRDEQRRSFDITIAGETNLDLILYGLPEKMSVERELLGSGFQVTLGGSSSILAHNLAAPRWPSRIHLPGRPRRDGKDSVSSSQRKRCRSIPRNLPRRSRNRRNCASASWTMPSHPDLSRNYGRDDHR